MFLWCSQCLSCLWRSGFSRCLLWTIYWGRSSPGSSTWCAICEIFHPESCTAEEEEFAFICEAKGMVFDLPFTPLELGEAAVRVFWNWVGEESTDRAQLLCFFWRSSPALGGFLPFFKNHLIPVLWQNLTEGFLQFILDVTNIRRVSEFSIV